MRGRPPDCGRRRARRSICGRISSSPRWRRSTAPRACCSPTRSASARRSRRGLLLSELRERGWIERALIVCPAGLRDTWARELETRFGIRAADPRSGSDRGTHRVAATRRRIRGPATRSRSPRSISSSARRCWPQSRASRSISLIADEAHHLTPGTDRGAAVSSPRLARHVVRVGVGDAALGRRRRPSNTSTHVGAHGETHDDLPPQPNRRRPSPPPGTNIVLGGHADGRRSRRCSRRSDHYTRAIWRERGRHDHAVEADRRDAGAARRIERARD